MSLQQTLSRLIMKLPGRWLVKLSGGQPVTMGGRVLEPQIQFIAWSGRNRPPLHALPPEKAQAAMREMAVTISAPLEPGVSTSNFTIPGPDHNRIPVRLYRPEGQDPAAPMMVYYHMGGGVIGDLELVNAFCSILSARVKCPVLSVDYRLAPQHKFPAGIEDCIAAYEWALRHAGEYGAPDGVASVGGDSIGGNFAAAISQEMEREQKPLPALQLLVYPAIDLVERFPSEDVFTDVFTLPAQTMDWLMEMYLPEGHDRADPLISPGQTGVLDSLPPAVVATAGFDPLVDEGDDYAARLKSAGVPVLHKRFDELPHGFTAFTALSPGSRAACVEIADMVRRMYDRL